MYLYVYIYTCVYFFSDYFLSKFWYLCIYYLSGSADFQFYSLATPNGQKVGVLLEELGIDYDAHNINIMVSYIW
jgi:hypothetical protein